MNFGLAVSQRHRLHNLEFTSVTDWSRHLLDHYSSRAWYSKHISELKNIDNPG